MILPSRNRRDLEEIPADARNKLEFVWAERVDDALAAALSTRRTQSPAKKTGEFCARSPVHWTLYFASS